MNGRTSGILLHITSLPSPFGVGDLGPEAYRFADFLSSARQSCWQVLPLTPTEQVMGNSPYSSISAFAGNALLISPELLAQSGLLTEEDLAKPPAFPEGRCDYTTAAAYKAGLLNRAYERFISGHNREDYDSFCARHAEWLDDYALFVAVKDVLGGKVWSDWDTSLRDRDPRALHKTRDQFHEKCEQEKFFQYLFFSQWSSLRAYCAQKGIQLIGDIPIYVNYDSVDVWTHAEIFELDGGKRPLFVSGVPPDYFSETGQLWGNPIYRWDALQATRFRWWFRRIEHNLHLFDTIRIDHFRGFAGYWKVPSTEKTAVNGQWELAPADNFFSALIERFPGISVIAEDLGLITEDVKEIMARFGFPGMRVLLFAFGEDNPAHPFLPHNYPPNCVAYTGTHDNNTTRGWFEKDAAPEERERVFRYLGRRVTPDEIHTELVRLAMMSVAGTVIIPMQDILGLGEEARMNRPSTPLRNWEWRLLPDQITLSHREALADITRTYGRSAERPW